MEYRVDITESLIEMPETELSPSPVIARREGALGRITLNRPRAINALSWEMIELIDAALDGFDEDPEVRCVLIDGNGERGFCAGGDVVSLRDLILEGGTAAAAGFWVAEYRLNARIGAFPKPVVAVMDGITMGGGIGLGGHASHRVVTERTQMAMPEVRIGLHPDVGGTFLLARTPGQLGLHLAMTAEAVSGADAIFCGLADAFLASSDIPELIERLGDGDPDAVIGALARRPPQAPLRAARGSWIDAAYSARSAEEIVARLSACPEPAAQAAAETIATKCPASVKVTLRAVRAARALPSLEAALIQEYRITLAVAARPDFLEGVRAHLVDKDRHPAWSPDSLEGVSAAEVARCFVEPDGGDLTFAPA